MFPPFTRWMGKPTASGKRVVNPSSAVANSSSITRTAAHVHQIQRPIPTTIQRIIPTSLSVKSLPPAAQHLQNLQRPQRPSPPPRRPPAWEANLSPLPRTTAQNQRSSHSSATVTHNTTPPPKSPSSAAPTHAPISSKSDRGPPVAELPLNPLHPSVPGAFSASSLALQWWYTSWVV